jgi:hypothetical protein
MPEPSTPGRSSRYLMDLPFFYTATLTPGPTTGSGRTRDISEAGACLDLPEALPPGARVRFVCQTEAESLALEAEVVWQRPSPLPGGHTLHGVRFPPLTAVERRSLQALFQRKGASRVRVQRLAAALPVRCRPTGGVTPALRGWTAELSREGCALLLPDRLPAGTPVEVTLTTPRGECTAPATVVWTAAEATGANPPLIRHGVRFAESDLVRNILIGLVVERVPSSPSGSPTG